jgi:hypothetical protein
MKIETISVPVAQEKITSKPEGICVLELIRKTTSADILDESVESRPRSPCCTIQNALFMGGYGHDGLPVAGEYQSGKRVAASTAS